MSEKKQTAAKEYLRGLPVDGAGCYLLTEEDLEEYGRLCAEEAVAAKAMQDEIGQFLESQDGALKRTIGQIKAEAREELLKELRYEEAYKATMVICDEDHTEIVNGIASVRHYRSECGAGMRRVIAIATQHGKDVAKKELLAEWRATDVEEWLRRQWGMLPEQFERQQEIRKALAMAKAQGAEAKVEELKRSGLFRK